MNHDSQLKHLTVLYWLGGEHQDAATSWAEHEYSNNPDPHPLLTELFAGQIDTGSLLAEIASSRFGFVPSSADGESFARSILATHLRRFLAREISPHELCKIVWAIDNKYLDARPMVDESVTYYPDWLGGLWNACDWCDETWTHSIAGQLVSEAQTVLNCLAADEAD